MQAPGISVLLYQFENFVSFSTCLEHVWAACLTYTALKGLGCPPGLCVRGFLGFGAVGFRLQEIVASGCGVVGCGDFWGLEL